MTTNFQMIKELDSKYTPEKRGVVRMKEIYLINEALCLDEMDILQLRNLRDFVVMYYDKQADKYEFEHDTTAMFVAMDKMSSITAVIDNKLVNMGAEV